jgi:hypothetical protein
MAQAIRAILFASATAATFVGRRSINLPSHSIIRVGFVMSAICLVCPKQQTLPRPVGTSHLGHKETYRPDRLYAQTARSLGRT